MLQKEDVIKQHNASKQALETQLKGLQSQIEQREQKIKNQEATLAQTLKENLNQNIIIQGHTDNLEIGPDLRKFYPTNWELSAGRSTTVLRYLIESAGIGPDRCSAAAYSYYKPVASNQSEAGCEQNRRIEIILVPER